MLEQLLDETEPEAVASHLIRALLLALQLSNGGRSANAVSCAAA
jgi:hypothetical protein